MYFGYGIIRQSDSQLESVQEEINRYNLYVINEGEISMVCFQTTEEEAGPTQEGMRRYTEALGHVTKHTVVIPLRFGTLFDDEEQVKEVLSTEAKNYTKLLSEFANKIEVELKLWWKKESFQSVMLKNKRLSMWKKAIENGVGQGFDVVEFGKAIQETADAERKRIEKDCLALLRPLAVHWILKDPADELQAFDGVFLVERTKEEAFDEAVGKLHDKYGEIMIFKYTGPWAPHHFV